LKLAKKEQTMSVIEVNHLTKYYGKARGIVDVSFAVEEGEIFGFIGPNGAGKSTTIRLLLALIHPTSGNATIFGKDCIRHGPEIRRHIGYLPSEVFYYERMKVRDLLRYSASFYEGDFSGRMHELAEYMELEMDRRIEDLSYGNKKKVGIVQGLLHQPKLLFLDEPTSGVDAIARSQFWQMLQLLKQRWGIAILITTHYMSEAEFCDRVVLLRQGRKIADDTVENLYREYPGARSFEEIFLAFYREPVS
jgi:ABC-2 type transport system ATP-binding protein